MAYCRRHAQWHGELKALLDSPLGDGNEFDRSMIITDKARNFYKEAMRMEDYYRNSMIEIGLAILYHDGYLSDLDLLTLPERLRLKLKNQN